MFTHCFVVNIVPSLRPLSGCSYVGAITTLIIHNHVLSSSSSITIFRFLIHRHISLSSSITIASSIIIFVHYPPPSLHPSSYLFNIHHHRFIHHHICSSSPIIICVIIIISIIKFIHIAIIISPSVLMPLTLLFSTVQTRLVCRTLIIINTLTFHIRAS